MKTIILFSGNARSGKDYISEKLKSHLEKTNSVCKFAFADLLKQYLCILFNISLDELDKLKNTEEIFTKNNLTMRDLLQRFGTELFVNTIDKYYWTKQVANKILTTNSKYFIISDFRFLHELDISNYLPNDCIIKTVKIVNFEQIKSSSHLSEKNLDNFKFDVIINNTNYSYSFDINDFKEIINE